MYQRYIKQWLKCLRQKLEIGHSEFTENLFKLDHFITQFSVIVGFSVVCSHIVGFGQCGNGFLVMVDFGVQFIDDFIVSDELILKMFNFGQYLFSGVCRDHFREAVDVGFDFILCQSEFGKVLDVFCVQFLQIFLG